MLLAAIDIDLPSGVGAYAPGTAIAVLAAVLCAVGSVPQQEVAEDSAPGGSLRRRALARRPTCSGGRPIGALGTARGGRGATGGDRRSRVTSGRSSAPATMVVGPATSVVGAAR